MNFENDENNEIWKNDGKGNEFNNEISFLRKWFTFLFIINIFYNCVMAYYYYDIQPLAIYLYLYNDITNFIIDLKIELPKKLLKYNGFFSDSSSDASSDAVSDVVFVPEVIKYEDKYLDDIKKLSVDYKFTLTELDVRDKKFNQLYEAHKINLVNEIYKLNQEILEKSMEYLEICDETDYENNSIHFNSDEVNSDEFCSIEKDSLEKESRKKVMENEISIMRSRIKELEEISDDDDVISKLKLEACDFVIKERLDALKNNFIMEKTPLGNVILYWNNSRESFEFYSDNTIPYRYLETVGRKYVKTFNCRQIYFDMEFELSEFERKEKEKELELKLLEDKKKMELEQNTSFNSNLKLIEKKDVFAKFKNYNKESGTGKVNRGTAPPKNSIPNNNNMKTSLEKIVLKENANRYTCEGKIANFNFLKKPDRKVIDKKYAMSFAEFKKLNL